MVVGKELESVVYGVDILMVQASTHFVEVRPLHLPLLLPFQLHFWKEQFGSLVWLGHILLHYM